MSKNSSKAAIPAAEAAAETPISEHGALAGATETVSTPALGDDLGEPFDMGKDEASEAYDLMHAPLHAPEPPLAAAKMPENRQSLHAVTHETHEGTRHADGEVHGDETWGDWAPPANLDAPTPRPGFGQKWVRFDLRGAPDAKNIGNMSRQGWRPRRVSSVPEVERARFPVVSDAKLGDIIKNGELVLCEMPLRLIEQRNAHFKNKHLRQLQSLPGRLAETNRNISGHGFGNLHVEEERSRVTTRTKTIVQAG